MMPIKYELQEQPKYIADEEEIVDGYEIEKYIHFMPEFLEKLRQPNNNNATIMKYHKEKSDYTYIGSIKCKGEGINFKENYVVEYYYNTSKIIAFIVLIPSSERYYNSIQAIAIFKMKGDVC